MLGTAFFVAWKIVRWALTIVGLAAVALAIMLAAPESSGPIWDFVRDVDVL